MISGLRAPLVSPECGCVTCRMAAAAWLPLAWHASLGHKLKRPPKLPTAAVMTESGLARRQFLYHLFLSLATTMIGDECTDSSTARPKHTALKPYEFINLHPQCVTNTAPTFNHLFGHSKPPAPTRYVDCASVPCNAERHVVPANMCGTHCSGKTHTSTAARDSATPSADSSCIRQATLGPKQTDV